ncbi:hypothetical protein HDV06_005488 [Boothiomyces sp. JEL0866]|nr:hypothetical protein HDV06_005488 [Boothiomyces sp. JEL0866]
MTLGEMNVDETQLPAKLQQIITQVYQNYSDCIPGAIFSAVYNGKVVHVDPYGYANAELQIPLSQDKSLFKIGSITQVFTVIALLQIWEKHFDFQDLFAKDLNDIILHLEANFANNSIGFSMPNNGFQDPITIWNLLTHTAGLEDGSLGIDTHSYDTSSTLNMNSLYFNRIHLLNNNFAKRIYPPNTVISHSNGGFVILGYVLELLTNQPYPLALKELVLDPLQMYNTTAASHAMQTKDNDLILTEPHTSSDSKFVLLSPEEQIRSLSMSDGGIILTNADINKLLICLTNRGKFNGKQIISARILSLLVGKQFESHIGSNYSSTCGMMHLQCPTYGGLLQVSQDGYLNGHASQLVIYPEHQFGYFISINYDNPWKVFGSLTENIKYQLFRSAETTDVDINQGLVPLNPSLLDLKQFAGSYISTRKQDSNFLSLFTRLKDRKYTNITVSEDGNYLIKNNSVRLTPMYFGEPSAEKIVFLESGFSGSGNNQTSAFIKGRLYSGVETMFFDDYLDTYHRVDWFQKVEYHENVIKTIIASTTVNLFHHLANFIFSKKSKLSVASLVIGFGILSLPTSVSLYSMTTRNKIELVCKKPPKWVKMVFGVSHVGIAAACGYLLTRNRRLGESVALYSGLATLAMLKYWNLEFWKV